MQKFEYKFDSLPYNEVNEKRVRDVLSKTTANYSLHRHESGCVNAVVYLPSFMEFISLEALFRSAGLRS
jgi:hypothetical protein